MAAEGQAPIAVATDRRVPKAGRVSLRDETRSPVLGSVPYIKGSVSIFLGMLVGPRVKASM